MLDAGNFRQAGPAAGGDQDFIRCDGAIFRRQINCMRIAQFRPRMNNIRARIVQPALVQGAEARNLLILVGDKRWPIEAAFADLPAKTGGVFEILAEMAGVYEQFLRHTAPNDAGAAITEFLGNANLDAPSRRHAPCAHAPRPAADYEQIKIIFCHGDAPLNISD